MELQENLAQIKLRVNYKREAIQQTVTGQARLNSKKPEILFPRFMEHLPDKHPRLHAMFAEFCFIFILVCINNNLSFKNSFRYFCRIFSIINFKLHLQLLLGKLCPTTLSQKHRTFRRTILAFLSQYYHMQFEGLVSLGVPIRAK